MAEFRKRCTGEFELGGVRLLERSGGSAMQLERELGIGRDRLWQMPFPALTISLRSGTGCGD